MWNWQQTDWPHFTYEAKSLEKLERTFLHKSGILRGTFQHLGDDEKSSLIIDFISNEALKTSEIEGEYLRRTSLQSSIRQHFGLAAENYPISAAERGIANLMVDLYQTFGAPLTHETLYSWHKMLMGSRPDVQDIGCYRTHLAPMQVISAYGDVHFEAPPSTQMTHEMDSFVTWFNCTAPDESDPLPALIRAGMTHLYFVSIHPFEDGNGRIGRALAEKALAQSLGQPTLLALSHTIEQSKREYYRALGQANGQNEITTWLLYFAQTLIAAQSHSLAQVEFLIAKAKLFDQLRGQLNLRQEKVVLRMFREGPAGFEGGLSAKNYRAIAKTSKATATRDLTDLVAKGALIKQGTLKYSRYYLNLSQPSPPF